MIKWWSETWIWSWLGFSSKADNWTVIAVPHLHAVPGLVQHPRVELWVTAETLQLVSLLPQHRVQRRGQALCQLQDQICRSRALTQLSEGTQHPAPGLGAHSSLLQQLLQERHDLTLVQTFSHAGVLSKHLTRKQGGTGFLEKSSEMHFLRYTWCIGFYQERVPLFLI